MIRTGKSRIKYIANAVLLICIGFGLSAGCDRGGPIDPEGLQQAVGRRAFKFYARINEARLQDAVQYVSPRLLNTVDDAAQLPIFREKMKGEYDRLMPQQPRVDFRARDIYIDVTIQRLVPATGDGRPARLEPIRTETHLWSPHDGEWYYDGRAGDQ